jgi:hypothetical protein
LCAANVRLHHEILFGVLQNLCKRLVKWKKLK